MAEENDDAREELIADAKRRREILAAHVAQLAEHFESVQIFVSSNVGEEHGTLHDQFGSGNWFARYGQVKEWIVTQDEKSRAGARKEIEQEDGD